MRIRIGDIVVNKWAREDGIERKGIYVGSGVIMCATEKNVYFAHYDMRKVDKDKEHFVVVGNYPIKETLLNVLNNAMIETEQV